MINTFDSVRRWLLHPPLSAPPVTTLIRLMVGAVFLWEAIMTFILPDTLGPWRFALIGLPAPDLMSPFDAAFEAGCGILIMLGLLTRLAAMPMLVDMAVAILSTKIPLLLGTSPLPPPVAPQVGFWALLHESRSDYAQLTFTAFLLVAGPGVWALDAALPRRSLHPPAPTALEGGLVPATPEASQCPGRPVRLIGG